MTSPLCCLLAGKKPWTAMDCPTLLSILIAFKKKKLCAKKNNIAHTFVGAVKHIDCISDVCSLFVVYSHVNQTTTKEPPPKDWAPEEIPPQPRTVTLNRDSKQGFGFVAGSEKPVIVRYI
jgi:hypothetical protein